MSRYNVAMKRMQLLVATLLFICVIVGCSSSCAPSRTSVKTNEEVDKTKPDQRCFADDKTNDHVIRNFKGKVFAIGDLHGDLTQTYNTLKLAGAINDKHEWIGTCMVVVQTGDQLDRGDEDREILDELERLSKEALAHDSRLIVLNGNHELMNSNLDLRYTTRNANLKFEDKAAPYPSDPLHPMGENVVHFLVNHRPFSSTIRELFKKTDLKHYGVRATAFSPGQNYANLLSKRSFYAIVNDSVFVHGGISSEHIQYGLEKANDELRRFFTEGIHASRLVTGSSGPFWMRDYSEPENIPASVAVCAKAAGALKVLNAKRMVVGHSIQKSINAACNDSIWRIDIGMSKAYGERPAQILAIDGDKVTVLE